MGNSLLRTHFGRESSSSPSTSTSQHRRMLSRADSSSSTPSSSPTRASSSSLHNIFHHTSRSSSPALRTPTKQSAHKESDAECWERMLALQMEYHCYNSARLEAAVEALESGWSIEQVPIPSRLCLDLLNEELMAQIESEQRAELQR